MLIQHGRNRNTSVESVLLLPKSGYMTEKLMIYLITWPMFFGWLTRQRLNKIM
jgi:hypothetical protein